MTRRSLAIPSCRTYLRLCALMACSVASIPLGVAADVGATTSPGVLEDILVTAQKREQRLQDVGVSETAFGAKDLQDLQITSPTDLVQHVVGLQSNQFSPALTVFNIRGVSQNDSADHYEPPVAVYQDDSYSATMAGGSIPIFDMQRVEVMRGPQGTLFGRNATGGLVQFISNKPTDGWEGYGQATFGTFRTRELEGAISGPITKSLQFRLAGLGEVSDGYMRDATSADHGDNDHYSLRLHVAWQPTDNVSALLTLRDTRNKHEVQASMYTWNAAYPNAQGLGYFIGPTANPWGTCPGCDAIGYKSPYVFPSPWQVSTNFANDFDRTMKDASFKIAWSLVRADIVSISDYQRLDKAYIENCGSAPIIECIFPANQFLTQYSEEIRVSAKADSAHHWVLGAYYLSVDSRDKSGVATPAFGGPYAYATDIYRVKTKSWAVFAQDDYAFSESWSGTVGVRYWNDAKTDDYYDNVADGPTAIGFESYFNPTLNPGLANPTFHDVSAKLEVDYKPTRDVLTYLSWNRGTKSGGFSAPMFFPPDPAALKYDNEVLNSYEIGAKVAAFGGKLRLNLAAFYYDYRKYQAFSYIDLVEAINNRQASERGAEVEADWAPSSNWYVHIGASTLDSTVKGVVLPDGEIVDRSLPQAPSFSGNALLRFQWHSFGGTASIQADAAYNGPQYFTVLESPVDYEGGRTVMNARASYTSADSRWTTSLSATNLTNKIYRIYSLDLSIIGLANSRYAPPRWALLAVTYRFGRPAE